MILVDHHIEIFFHLRCIPTLYYYNSPVTEQRALTCYNATVILAVIIPQ